LSVLHELSDPRRYRGNDVSKQEPDVVREILNEVDYPVHEVGTRLLRIGEHLTGPCLNRRDNLIEDVRYVGRQLLEPQNNCVNHALNRRAKETKNRVERTVKRLSDSGEETRNRVNDSCKDFLNARGNLLEVTSEDSDNHVQEARDNLHRALKHRHDSIPSTLEDRGKHLAETLPDCAQNLRNALEVETKLVYALNDSITEGIERLDKPVPRLD